MFETRIYLGLIQENNVNVQNVLKQVYKYAYLVKYLDVTVKQFRAHK